ncbi:MAG: cell division protein SepF [Cyanobacteria bacterium P01_F01_bin.33]
MTAFLGKVKDFMGFGDSGEPLEEAYSDYANSGYGDSYKESASRDVTETTENYSGRQRWATAADTGSEWQADDRAGRGRSRVGTQNLGSNVIGLPGVQQSLGEMVILKPQSFEEMANVVQFLRDRKSVILNLTLMEPAEAQRSVDFVAGGTYAIDGHQERVGDNIFLFTPNCVTVSIPGSLVEELADEAVASTPQTIAPPTSIWDGNSFDDLQAVGDR